MRNARELTGLSLLVALVLLWAIAALVANPSANYYGMYDFHPPPSPYWSVWFQKLHVDSRFAIARIDWRVYAVLPLYLGALLWLGSRLSARLFGSPPGAALPAGMVRPDLFDKVFCPLAGFVLCYVATSGLNRLLSLFATARAAAWLSLATIAAVVLVQALRRKRVAPVRAGSGVDWRAAAIVTVLIGLAGVLSVQYGFAFVTGDRSLFELERVVLDPRYGPGRGNHLPLFGYHYDELSFLLPVLYIRSRPFPDPDALLVPIWAMGALVKLSAFALTAVLLRRFGMRPLAAVLATVLVYYGALTFNPAHRYYLFDSANPVFFTLHPGRVISSLGLFWCLALATWLLRAPQRWQRDWWWVPLALLLGFGISGLTINVAINTTAALLVVAALCVIDRPAAERGALAVAIAFSAAGLPLIYLRFEHYASWGAIAYLAGLLVVVLSYPALAWRRPCLLAGRASATDAITVPWRALAVLLIGIVAGLCAGNMVAKAVVNHLPFLGRLDFLAPQAELVKLGDRLLQAGTMASPHWPIAHQNGFGAFAAHFGLPIVLATLAWAALRRSGEPPQRTAAEAGTEVPAAATVHADADADDRRRDIARALLIALCAFLSGLFFMDFVLVDTDFAKPGWDYFRQFSVRTRLVESGYYAVILLSLLALWRRLGKRPQQLLLLGMVILIAGPELSRESRIFKQATHNAAFVLRMLNSQ